MNFLLTNRIPRQLLTRFMGRFSRLEHPLVRDASLALFRFFARPELGDAKKDDFTSLHDCFIRELKPGARCVDTDPNVLISPCDAIVGACGRVQNGELIQAKDSRYTLSELLVDRELAASHEDGSYVTLRLTAGMYHRFHAPADCDVHQVTYVSGDTWNTNPITLDRVERLFCKNERAVLRLQLTGSGLPITLVPVASVLIASIRLHFLDVLLHLGHRGPDVIPCQATLHKGQEMGWFQHGSTILVFAPQPLRLSENVVQGRVIRMGEPLLRLP